VHTQRLINNNGKASSRKTIEKRSKRIEIEIVLYIKHEKFSPKIGL
jgi:hypothetical protein